MTALLFLLLQADGALQKAVEKLVAELGASGLEARQEAEAALKKIGEKAYPFLAASAEHPDPEIRGRVRDLIRHLRGPAKLWEWALPEVDLMRFHRGAGRVLQPRELHRTLRSHRLGVGEGHQGLRRMERRVDPPRQRRVREREGRRKRVLVVGLAEEIKRASSTR